MPFCWFCRKAAQMNNTKEEMSYRLLLCKSLAYTPFSCRLNNNNNRILEAYILLLLLLQKAFFWSFHILLVRLTNFYIWSSSWDCEAYQIGNQQRLRWACASAQYHQPLLFAHMKYGSRGRVQPKNQTVWLRMRVWGMNLRRTKSTIISWDGSFFGVFREAI